MQNMEELGDVGILENRQNVQKIGEAGILEKI
jgi:hypothetical protein